MFTDYACLWTIYVMILYKCSIWLKCNLNYIHIKVYKSVFKGDQFYVLEVCIIWY